MRAPLKTAVASWALSLNIIIIIIIIIIKIYSFQPPATTILSLLLNTGNIEWWGGGSH